MPPTSGRSGLARLVKEALDVLMDNDQKAETEGPQPEFARPELRFGNFPPRCQRPTLTPVLVAGGAQRDRRDRSDDCRQLAVCLGERGLVDLCSFGDRKSVV